MSAAGSAVRETAASLRTVFRNPGLRRINLALAGSLIGDWAYATAVAVWAYGQGGATAVGIWGVVRLSLLAVVTPFAATLADRFPRKRVMVTSDLIRGALVVLAAVCVFVETTPWLVFGLATLAALVAAPFRPSQQALMPQLADSTDELTAANGVASTLESLAFFVGPAIGGFLLAVADVPIVFLLNAATFVWSAFLVSGIVVRHADIAEVEGSATAGEGASTDGPAEPEESVGFLKEALAGFSTIWADRNLRMIFGMYCAQTVVAGASIVFGVAIAVDLVGLGPQGVGYLDSVFGIGALIGGLIAVGRATSHRLASDFGIGVILWALPLLAIWAWPNAAAAFGAVAIMGMANPVVDVNASTILQRLTPDAVLGRVFGALDTGLIATMAFGSLIMPILIHTIGLRDGLAVVALGVTACVIPGWRALRRLDDSLRPPEGTDLLRAITLFAPLSQPAVENLARRLVTVPVAAGTVILREGDEGDRFYVLESGDVAISREGADIAQAGPGGFFGEIALLRDVPRTATVTATTDCVLKALEREDFLDAIQGSDEVATLAEELVSRRLPNV